MSTPELHRVFVVYVDGVLVNKAHEVDFELDANDQPVMTITGGFDGITPAPNVRSIRIKKMMPGESDEGIDFEEIKANKRIVPVRVVDMVSGAQSESLCAIIGKVSTTSGVGKNSEQEASFQGAWAPFT
jgi:hypothetical protein